MRLLDHFIQHGDFPAAGHPTDSKPCATARPAKSQAAVRGQLVWLLLCAFHWADRHGVLFHEALDDAEAMFLNEVDRGSKHREGSKA